MFRGIFSQIVVTALGVAIIILYTEPLLSEIGEMQDQITEYRTEREKVESVNNRLFAMEQQILSIPQADQLAVNKFLPDTEDLDTVGITRDIEFIMEAAEVSYEQIKMQETGSNESNSVSMNSMDWVQHHSVQVDFTGSYENIKKFFELLPRNEYPITVVELSLEPEDGSDVLRATGTFNVYSYVATNQNAL